MALYEYNQMDKLEQIEKHREKGMFLVDRG